MNICYLDAFSGLSGDMLVGALADAGASTDAIGHAIGSLNIGVSVRFERVLRRGISATKFHVEAPQTKTHRHLSGILKMIDAADLPDQVKTKASGIFRRLGDCEAAVHGVPVEKVHFHEVGAADSIADIVGAAMAFELIGTGAIHCSPINTGSGTVETEHGTLPVPAPATAALLQGAPIYARGPEVELTTPTGAAVVTALAQNFGPLPPMSISRIGYGAGDRDFKQQANVLRVLVGTTRDVHEAQTVALIEANIDDSTPEVLAYTAERLMRAGALDVTLQPIVMKKGRPGSLLRVLSRLEDREELAAVVFAETSTLGVRTYTADRLVEERRIVEVETRFGRVRVKVAGNGHAAPEYEDCRALAAGSSVPLREVIAEALWTYRNSL